MRHLYMESGRDAKKALQIARQKVANAINAKPKEIYFTSCGSESDNLALKGVAYKNREKKNHIITTKIEHPAILHTCQTLQRQGFDVTYLNVDENGFISLTELENAINDKTILISVMFANNEIGTIEPISQIGKIAKKHNVLFHTDSVQAIGNVRIDVDELNIDLLSMSAHKFYGPKGVGALYVREGVEFERIQDGGHQERDKRSGTENVAGIVGLAEAIKISYENFEKYNKKLTDLREYYFSQVQEKIPNIKINGDRKLRLPGNASVSFANVQSEEVLFKLDEKGICASGGSACSTGNPSPSHVLLAIGADSTMAKGTIRVTFGLDNQKEDVDYLVDNLSKIVEELRKEN